MSKFAFFVFLCLLFSSCTTSVKPSLETYMGKAVFDVGIQTPSQEVVNNVYDSIALRSAGLSKTVAFMPTTLPDAPGTPNVSIKSMGFGMATFGLPQTTCDGAYAIMSGFDKGVSSSTFGTSDYASYTSCIYPYKDAYRVYLIGNFMSSSSGGLQGMMADAIKKGVASSAKYNNIFDAWFDSIIIKMRQKFPEAKQVEVAMP